MYARILVGYMDTEQGRDALALGRILAQANAAEMMVVTAPGEDGADLSEIAHDNEVDLIVLGGSHRGPIGRVIPGATVERLLGDPPCAVAVAPPGFGRPADGDSGWRPLGGGTEDTGIRVIGVGYDGSSASKEALKTAVELAVPNGAALRVYTVARKFAHVPGGDGDSRGPGVPTEAEILRGILHKAVAALPAEARALPVFIRGFPDQELIKAAEYGVDLLVLGSRAGGPVRRLLHHSVSSTVMREASCPVLISPSNVAAPQATLA
jgi:nucleotide-binding universal stress UspA family protein